LLCTVVLASWSLLPSCGGEREQQSFVKGEIDHIKNLTVPDGSYPINGPDKPSSLYGITTTWEFDTAMSSEAYIRWVSSRVEPAFTPHTNSQSGCFFSRYRDGDEEIIRIDTTLRSGKLHVLVTLDMYAD